jgi:hypothetical protein
MSATKQQRRNERFAKLCDEIGGPRSIGGTMLRAVNRRIEKRKRKQFRSKP